MILTCPDCATSYFVDDERVPAQGRTVKCSSCGARWRALPEGAEPEPEFDPPPLSPPVAEPEPEPVVEPVVADDDIEFVAAPAKPALRPAKAPKRGRTGLFIGIGIAAALLGVGVAAILLRQPVVNMVPQTAPLYAALGLKVDTLGLIIEGVKSETVFQAGRPVLSVTGAIRNTRDEPVQAPPIRISLLDKASVAVGGLVAQPTNAKIPPGGRRYFAVALPDPPSGAHELEIGFDPPARPAAAGAHSAPVSHPAPTHGAEPVEAKALPPDSPDALPKHDGH